MCVHVCVWREKDFTTCHFRNTRKDCLIFALEETVADVYCTQFLQLLHRLYWKLGFIASFFMGTLTILLWDNIFQPTKRWFGESIMQLMVSTDVSDVPSCTVIWQYATAPCRSSLKEHSTKARFLSNRDGDMLNKTYY